jgi:hypothetical protein
MFGYVDNTNLFKWGNVLHFGYTGTAPTGTVCMQIAGYMNTQWSIHMAPEVPSPTMLYSTTVTDLTSDSSGEGTAISMIPGSRGDDSIPANACVLVHYPQVLRYKGGHPRQYLFAGGNADLQGAAQWSTLFQDEIKTHWEAFIQGVEGYSLSGTTVGSLCFVRYHSKFLPNSGPPKYYLTTPIVEALDVTQATIQPEMASQRRRIGRAEGATTAARRNTVRFDVKNPPVVDTGLQ